MRRLYKLFLVIFILLIGYNLLVIDWDLGFFHEENTKFVFSLSASVLGTVLVIVLDTWSRLGLKTKKKRENQAVR
ncbi:MAG: hypothetical protein FDW93_06940 [Bergeyella sp.]|nr:hypothetical protein [Bergeyella sp.]